MLLFGMGRLVWHHTNPPPPADRKSIEILTQWILVDDELVIYNVVNSFAMYRDSTGYWEI